MAYTERLIEHVKNYAMLYDLTHDDYKNTRTKDKIWDLIGKELKENGEDVKKKWKNLRDTYAKHLKSTKTRTGLRAKKVKPWQWANQMEMFRPFISLAKPSSNTTGIFADKDSESRKSEMVELTEEHIKVEETHLEMSDDVESEKAANHMNNALTKNISQLPSSVDTVIRYVENEKMPIMTPTELIFLSYARTIESFSARRQATAKLKIAEIMVHQEMLHQEEILAGPCSTSSSQPTSSSFPYSST